MKQFTQLEREVLDWMANELSIPNLKEQIRAATFIEREHTGVGSFTEISVSSGLPSVNCPSPIIGPTIESDGIEYGGSSILFLVDSGHLDTLEMVANGDSFAESIAEFQLS